jgi:hypothetical protein
LPCETGAHQELALDILASGGLQPSEETEAVNVESGNLCLSPNSGCGQIWPKIWKLSLTNRTLFLFLSFNIL